MNFLLIFLIPLCGIIVAAFLVKLFPKAQFSGYDILPFFFIVACQLLTQETKQPSFLPYGFLLYFILYFCKTPLTGLLSLGFILLSCMGCIT